MESFYLDKYTYYLKIQQHNHNINKKEKTEKNVQLNKSK